MDHIVDERLRNWARVVRFGWRPQLSMTGIICARLAKENKVFDEGEKESPPDEPDAWVVEKTWAKMQAEKEKKILRSHYVLDAHRGATCRILAIRHAEYDLFLNRAQNMIHNQLKILDIR